MTVIQRSTDFLRKYAAVIIFFFCLSALYIFVSIGFRSVFGPVLGGAIGGLVAIVVLHVYGSVIQDTESQSPNPPDYRIPIIITSLYIISIIIMYRFILYDRPLLHYLVFGGFAGYITYEIATGVHRSRVVPQILILSFFTYWSSQFAFPAGASSPDVLGKAIPTIREGLVQAHISIESSAYLGYLVYVAESSLLMGISPEMTYVILATIVLVGTLLLLSVLDLSLPKIPREVALYAALLFGCMSWTLSRGMWPNKLNFFYPMILLIGLAALRLFSSTDQLDRKRWLVIGGIVSPALIFGHRFSSGAAMVFLGTIGMFITLYYTVLKNEYTSRPRGLTLTFVGAYILSIVGNPIHFEPLLGRFSSLILSVLAPVDSSASASASASGGAGRYSDFALDLLLANTAGQAILFALTVFGAALVIRYADWEYDLVIFWMAVLSVLIIGSVVFNARDFQPQRFYALLGLFGLNICAGAALFATRRIISARISPSILAIAVCLFTIVSLTSPIAGIALSPFDNEIPHFPKYETEQELEGNRWVGEFTQDPRSIIPPNSDITIERSSQNRGKSNLTKISPGETYVYSDLANKSGIIIEDGKNIGGRNFVFVGSPNSEFDSILYNNGQMSVHSRNIQYN